jgi:hypothetical protein
MLTNANIDTQILNSVTKTKPPKTAKQLDAYGGQVDISDVWEAFYWCNALGCSFEELRAAVKARGTSAGAVRSFFES